MEEKMHKFSAMIGIALVIASLSTITCAGDAAKDECIYLCKKAAQLIKRDGLGRGIQVISDKNGPFVTKNTYVFLMDMDAKMVAHPMNPKLAKKGPLIKAADSTGKQFFAEFVKVANDHGKGWVSYMWPKPGEEKPSSKYSYVHRIAGTQYFVSAGVYK
jgi:cytochrome c